MNRSTSIFVLFLLSVLTAGVLLVSRGGNPVLPGSTAAPAADAETVLGASIQPGVRDRVEAEGTRGCWTAPVGSYFRFRVHDHSTCLVRGQDGSTRTSIELHTECIVTTKVLDRRNDELLIEQQISDLSFHGADPEQSAGEAQQQSFIAKVQMPVIVRMDCAGRVRGYGFAAVLEGAERNFLRSMLDPFHFEAPHDGVSTWNGSLDDTTGTCEVRYESAPEGDRVTVRRTRLRYTAVGDEKQLPVHEVNGCGRASFDLQLGWICEVELDEGLDLSLSLLDLRAISHRVAEVELIDSGTGASAADVAGAWMAADAPAAGRSERGKPSGNLRAMWQQRLRGVTVGQLLAELEQLMNAPPVDSEAQNAVFQQLQWLVKLDASAAAQLQEKLITRQLGIEASGVVIGALGAAGTAPAQHALAVLRTDATLDTPLREAATVACVQLGAPVPELMTGLCEGAASGELDGTSMLVLGALAPRASEQRIGDRSPFEVLADMESRAEARGELDTWVRAMGNTAAPEVLPIAQRLIDHGEPAVRRACCAALRDLTSPDALTILIQRGLTDADYGVRFETVRALARRPEAAARLALEQVAQSDPDARVRDRASRSLGQGD